MLVTAPSSITILFLISSSRHNLTFLVQHSQEETNQLLVFFTEEESVGIKPIKKYGLKRSVNTRSRICERMVTQSIMKGILIYQKSLTPSANKVISEMQPKYLLEPFSEAHLLVNITHHVLVPKHVVLSREEKKVLLAR
jgi:DNA-directed RNA polymerase I, II, and III subunit RPABC1